MRRVVLIAALAVALSVPSVTSAATITPTAGFFADDFTNNSNCSLREAIDFANTDGTGAQEDSCDPGVPAGDDTISLEAGTYLLDIAGTGGNTNANGDLDVDPTGVSGELIIDGAGAGTTTIDTDDSPAWADRVLHQVTSASPLTVSDLTITGGNLPSSIGGGILASGALTVERARVTGNAADSGGGINANTGSALLSISDSTIDLNRSTGLVGGAGVLTGTTATIDSSVIRLNETEAAEARAGGIRATGATGMLTVTDSVIAGNTAESTDTFTPAGGGIHVSNGTATFSGTTITGNKVLGGTFRTAAGVFVSGTGTGVTFLNSTVSGNEALLAGGLGAGLRVASAASTANVISSTFGPNLSDAPSALQNFGTLNIRGSVVETDGAVDACGGSAAITSQGDNVFTDTSCGAGTTGDETDADPQLGDLLDNGGSGAGAPGLVEPLLTHLPAQASTAVDHVPAADCDDQTPGAPLLLLDQRGLPRPSNGDGSGAADCDAGSVELQAAPPPPPAAGGGTATPPATAPPAPKKCKKGRKLKKGKCVKKKRKK